MNESRNRSKTHISQKQPNTNWLICIIWCEQTRIHYYIQFTVFIVYRLDHWDKWMNMSIHKKQIHMTIDMRCWEIHNEHVAWDMRTLLWHPKKPSSQLCQRREGTSMFVHSSAPLKLDKKHEDLDATHNQPYDFHGLFRHCASISWKLK